MYSSVLTKDYRENSIYGRGALAFWGLLVWVIWRNCTAKPCSD